MKLAPSQKRWLTCATLCILLAATIALLIDLLLCGSKEPAKAL